MTRHVTIGKCGGKNVTIDVGVLLKTRLLIQANSGGGKSYLMRRLAEQLFGKVPILIIDWEGEFSTLREKFGYVLVGKGGETPADPRTAEMAALRLLELRASAVCDLYELKPHQRHLWVKTFIESMMEAPKKLWKPTIIMGDEAHLYCPEKGQGESIASGAVLDLVTRGRKRGFCPILATQRLAKLSKNVSAELLNRLVGQTFEDVDLDRAAELLSIPRRERETFTHQMKVMEPGSFWALGRAITKERLLVEVGPVETTHPEPGDASYTGEPPPPPEKIKALLPKLADLPKEAEERAKTVEDLQAEIRRLKAELRARPTEKQVVEKVVHKKVEVPVLTEKQIQRLEKVWKATAEYADKFGGVASQLCGWLSDVLAQIEKQNTPEPPPRHEVVRISDGLVGVKIPKGAPPAPRGGHSKRKSVPVGDGLRMRDVGHGYVKIYDETEKGENEPLTPAQAKILQTLSELRALGHEHADKKMLAAMSEVPVTSGGFKNNLGRLQSLGYIDYPQPGLVCFTESGSAIVGEAAPPEDDPAMLERCCSVLTASQQTILRTLHEVYPETMDRGNLADVVGVPVTSGGFKNNLGRLHTLRMIEYPSKGHVRCAAWMFIEHRIQSRGTHGVSI